MEQLRIGFEKALKAKLSQKCTTNSSEEIVLFKAFKYFDTDNDEEISLQEWYKAIEKIGVILPSLDDLKALYNYYDTNKDGSLDYKEFSERLFRPHEEQYLNLLIVVGKQLRRLNPELLRDLKGKKKTILKIKRWKTFLKELEKN